LFREISEDIIVDGFERFTRSDGGESPARSTLSLVFNSLDFSFGNPIDISNGWRGIGIYDVVSLSGFETKIDVSEFCVGQVSEEVDGSGVGLGFVSVVFVDVFFVDHEDGSSVSFFFSCGIDFSVGSFELFEAVGLVLGSHHGTGDS